jgi:protein SCO1
MRRSSCTIVFLLALLSFAAKAGTTTDSIYLLGTPLTTQDGESARIDLHRGQPTLITMFYASCPHVCPTLIAAMRGMERRLPEDQRKHLRVLVVSLDPDRDTPEMLDELAKRHGVDLTRWSFARAEKSEVRKLAAVLGVQYRQLPDGEFNHSTVITLLDSHGRILSRTGKTTRPDEDFLQKLSNATRERQPQHEKP